MIFRHLFVIRSIGLKMMFNGAILILKQLFKKTGSNAIIICSAAKYIWHYMNEQDNYLLLQALAWLGSRRPDGKGAEVILPDCMPLKIGWKSLWIAPLRLDRSG